MKSKCKICGKEASGGIYADGDPYGDCKKLGIPVDEATNGYFCWEHAKDYDALRQQADMKLDAEFKSRNLCGFIESWVGKCKNQNPCAKHSEQKCWFCKQPATQNCGETGSFVCGIPECSQHPHLHRSSSWSLK